MVSKGEFVEQLGDAYEHLYDLVYLRTHPLATFLISDPHLRPKQRAWDLHHLLIDAVEEIDPGPQPPTFSYEWRRNRLLVLRYIDGLSPKAVANELAISPRHYYRERDAAIEVLAGVLWHRHVAGSAASVQEPHAPGEQEEGAGLAGVPLSRLELLRLETARVSQTDRYSHVDEVLDGALSLLGERMQERHIEVQLSLPTPLPPVWVNPNVLRQILLAMMGYLMERAQGAAFALAARDEENALLISLSVDPPNAIEAAINDGAQEQLEALDELGALGDVQIVPTRTGESVVGFDVRLPIGPRRTVLVVDDNQDVLELFRRYLSAHQFQVVTTRSTRDAVDMAVQIQPFAITLDLMMPEQDGWEVLQNLLHGPDTRHIPVVVISILRQKGLALSLGAAAFLQKPVTEQALLSTLEALAEP